MINLAEQSREYLKSALQFTIDPQNAEVIYQAGSSGAVCQSSLSLPNSICKNHRIQVQSLHGTPSDRLDESFEEEKSKNEDGNQLPEEPKQDQALQQGGSNQHSKSKNDDSSSSQTHPLQYMYMMRWNSQSKLFISPSGLTVIATSNQEEAAISSIGFSTGIHFCEFFAPISCMNLQFGVIKKGWKPGSIDLSDFQSFRTTTPRLIGLKLDLTQMSMKVWLNGIYQDNKKKDLKKLAVGGGPYYFAVLIKDIGNQVVCNPFAVDPEVPALPHLINASSQLNQEFAQQLPQQAQEAQKPPSDQSQQPQQQPIQMEGQEPQLDDNKCKQLIQNILQAVQQCKENFNMKEQPKKQEEDKAQKQQQQSMLFYKLENDNLLIQQGSKLKLLRRNSQGFFSFNGLLFENKPKHPEDKVHIAMNKQALQSLLVDLSWDEIILFQQKQSAASITITAEDLVLFFQSSTAALQNQSCLSLSNNAEEQLFVTVPFRVAKSVFTVISEILYQTIQELYQEQLSIHIEQPFIFSQQNQELEIFHKQQNFKEFEDVTVPFLDQNKQQNPPPELPVVFNSDQPQPPPSKPQQLSQSHLQMHMTLQQLNCHLRTALVVNEQLFAMTHHEECSPALLKTIPSNINRLFSAFGRLASFIGTANLNYSATDLAEVGVYNKLDSILEYRHYLAPAITIDLQRNDREIPLWSQVSEQLPQTLMAKGLAFPDVALHVSINNRPYQRHKFQHCSKAAAMRKSFNQQGVSVILPLHKSGYIATLASDGSMNIWNTELALINVCCSNFKEEFKKEEISHIALLFPHLTKGKDVKQLMMIPADESVPDLFNDLLTESQQQQQLNPPPNLQQQQSQQAVQAKGIICSKASQSLLQPQKEAETVPDQSIVDSLYNMGFSPEISKQAVIKSKNQGINQALEVVLVLQEEESKKPKPKVSNVTQIKPQWECITCTYINLNGAKQCEICNSMPPPDAYYTVNEQKEEKYQEVLSQMLEQQLLLLPQAKEPAASQPAEQDPIKIKEQQAEEEEKQNKLLLQQQKQRQFQRFMESATAVTGCSATLEQWSSAVCPLVCAAALNSDISFENETGQAMSLLRLRRFGFHPIFLKRFFKAQGEQYLVSTVTGELAKIGASNSEEECAAALYQLCFNTEAKRSLIQALEPTFIGRNRYSNFQNASKYNQSEWVAYEELNLTFSNEVILDCQMMIVPNSTTTFNLFILTEQRTDAQHKKSALYIHHYQLQIDDLKLFTLPNNKEEEAAASNKTNSMQTIFLQKTMLPENISQLKLLPISNNNSENDQSQCRVVALANNRSVININLSTAQIVEIQAFQNNIKDFQTINLSSGIFLDNQGNLHNLNLDDKQQSLLAPVQQTNEQTFNAIPDPATMPCEDLVGLKRLLSDKFVGCRSIQQVPLFSSFFDKQRHQFSLHAWQVPSSSNVFSVSFDEQTQISCIEFNMICKKKPFQDTIDNQQQLLKHEKVVDLGVPLVVVGENPSTESQSLLLSSNCESTSKKYYIPLCVREYQGSSMSKEFTVAHMLTPNEKSFISNYPGAQFTFQHLHGKSMLIETVTVMTTEKQISYGFSIGSGLVFTADNPSFFGMTHAFDQMPHEAYLEWVQAKQRQGGDIQPWEPVGGFAFSPQQYSITFELNYKRPAKYLFFKPTSFHTNVPSNRKQFIQNPIDIRFFGVQGRVIYQNSPERPLPLAQQWPQQEQVGGNIPQFSIEVCLANEQWEKLPLDDIKEAKMILDSFSLINYRYVNALLTEEDKVDIQSNRSCDYVHKYLISTSRLITKAITGIRISLSPDADKSSTLLYCTLQPFSSVLQTGDCCLANQNLSINTSSSSQQQIHQCLLEPKLYEKFNQKLVHALCDGSLTVQRRMIISGLLISILQRNSHILPAVLQDLDLHTFIRVNVLQSRENLFTEIAHFLRVLGISSTVSTVAKLNKLDKTCFSARLYQVLYKDLMPLLIEDEKVTAPGLQMFFQLLQWCQHLEPDTSFIHLLEQLDAIAKRIPSIKHPLYNVLRTHFKVQEMALEKELFFNQTIGFAKASLGLVHNINRKNLIYEIATEHQFKNQMMMTPQPQRKEPGSSNHKKQTDVSNNSSPPIPSQLKSDIVKEDLPLSSSMEDVKIVKAVDEEMLQPTSTIRSDHSSAVEPLKQQIIIQKGNFARKYVINLMQVHRVSEVILAFEQENQNHLQINMSLIVYALEYPSGKLVLLNYKINQPHLWIQLTQNAHQESNKKCFEEWKSANYYSNNGPANIDGEKGDNWSDAPSAVALNSYGAASNCDILAQYIIIQVGSSMIPFVAGSNVEQFIPNNVEILPEVYGSPLTLSELKEKNYSVANIENYKQDESLIIKSFKEIKKNELLFTKEVQIKGCSHPFKKYSLNDKDKVSLEVYDSTGFYDEHEEDQQLQQQYQQIAVALQSSPKKKADQSSLQSVQPFESASKQPGEQPQIQAQNQVQNQTQNQGQGKGQLKNQKSQHQNISKDSEQSQGQNLNQDEAITVSLFKINRFKEEQYVRQSIELLQAELVVKLEKYSSAATVDQGDLEVVKGLCKRIESLQLELYLIKEDNEQVQQQGQQSSGFIQTSKSLDFHYTLSQLICRLLGKIDEQVTTECEYASDVTSMKNKCTVQRNWRQVRWIQEKRGRQIALRLFKTFVVFEELEISRLVLTLLSDQLIDNLQEREWLSFIFTAIERYLSVPVLMKGCPPERMYSQVRVLAALDKISIPMCEVLSYISVKARTSTTNQVLTLLTSILILLNSGFKQIPAEDAENKSKLLLQLHEGAYCYNCASYMCISGVRLKCANCPNLDCCMAKPTCEQKHLTQYPGHVFIVIPEPLPLAPNRNNLPSPMPILAQSAFELAQPLRNSHGIECDMCNTQIMGTRFLCANCEDYSLCRQCFTKNEHTKYHVFIKLDWAIVQKESSHTPQPLIKYLDPLLYPLRSHTEEAGRYYQQKQQKQTDKSAGSQSPLPVLGKKLSKGVSRELRFIERSQEKQREEERVGQAQEMQEEIKQNVENEEEEKISRKMSDDEEDEDSNTPSAFKIVARLDYDESLIECQNLLLWICQTSSITEQDKSSMLQICLDLFSEIMKFSSMKCISELLLQSAICSANNSQNSNKSNFKNEGTNASKSSTSSTGFLYTLFFTVFKIGSPQLLEKLRRTLFLFLNPPGAPQVDEACLAQLKQNEKHRLLAEKQALDDAKIILIFMIQNILQQIIDFAFVAPTPTISQQQGNNMSITNAQSLYSSILQSQKQASTSTIAPSTWSQHLTFVLEFLIQASQQITFEQKSQSSSPLITAVTQSATLKEVTKDNADLQFADNLQLAQKSAATTKPSAQLDFQNASQEPEQQLLPSLPISRSISHQIQTSNTKSTNFNIAQYDQGQLQQLVELMQRCIENKQVSMPINLANGLVVLLFSLKLKQQNINQANAFNIKKNQQQQPKLLSPTTNTFYSTLRPGFTLSYNTGLWSLILQIILKAKVSLLIEGDYFNNIVRAFLHSTFEVQQALISQILQLTQNMVQQNQYQQEICNQVLKVFFKTLNSFSSVEAAVVGDQDNNEDIIIRGNRERNSLARQKEIAEIKLNLLQGWLDILLTKKSPKPEEYYTKPGMNEVAACRLHAQGALNLMSNVSRYLIEQVNFGGFDGAQLANEMQILKLRLAEDLISLLIYSTTSANSSEGKENTNNESITLSICELFASVGKEKSGDEVLRRQISVAMRQLISWFFINRTNNATSSPSTDSVKVISDGIQKLFVTVSQYEEVCKISITQLFKVCQSFDVHYQDSYANTQQLSTFSAFTYNQRFCQIMELLYDLWITNDTTASHIAFTVGGFEYLLNRMGVVGSQPSKKLSEEQGPTSSAIQGTDIHNLMMYQIAQSHETGISGSTTGGVNSGLNNNNKIAGAKQSLLMLTQSLNFSSLGNINKFTVFGQMQAYKKPLNIGELLIDSQQQQSISSAPSLQTGTAQQLTQQVQDELKEEEFATKLSCICQPGQNYGQLQPDWSTNKKGAKARIMWQSMTGSNYNEFDLVLQLEKTVELKQIKIGFHSVWTDYVDKVLGVPSSVMMEGGDSPNSLVPLGSLTLINDEGYTNFGVKVFVKNFQTIQDQSLDDDDGGNVDADTPNFRQVFQSLIARKASVLKFRFRRPVVTYIEQLSYLSGKPYKNVALSISFLSINGFDVGKFPNCMYRKIKEQQESSALQIVGKLCSQQFSETVAAIANDSGIVSKIKYSFDVLMGLLIQQEEWISSMLFSLASHNQQLGDWIISQLLASFRNKQQAKIITDIVCSTNYNVYPRILQLHNFVLCQVKSSNIKLHSSNIQQQQQQQPSNQQGNNTTTSTRKTYEQQHNALLDMTTSLIHCYITSLRISAENIAIDSKKETQNKEKLVFSTQISNIEEVILVFDQNHNSPFASRLIKLIVTLLYPPQPFFLEDQVVILNCIFDKLWAMQSAKPHILDLLTPLILGSKQGIDWLLKDEGSSIGITQDQDIAKDTGKDMGEEIGQDTGKDASKGTVSSKLAYLMQEILLKRLQKLDNRHKSNKLIQSTISMLAALSKIGPIRKLIIANNWHIQLYNSIKVSASASGQQQQQTQAQEKKSYHTTQHSQLVLKSIIPESIQCIVELLKNTILGQPEQEAKFAQLFREDINLLATRRDMTFVTGFLVPMLNAELQIPVCLHAYDQFSNKWLSECTKILLYQGKYQQLAQASSQLANYADTQHQSSEATSGGIFYLNSSLLSKQQRDSLASKTLFFYNSFNNKSSTKKQLASLSKTNQSMSDTTSQQWYLAFQHSDDCNCQYIDTIVNKVIKSAPFFIIVEGLNAGKKCAVGVFCTQNAEESQQYQSYQKKSYYIPYASDSFLFYYEEGQCMHFQVPDDASNIFGQINVIEDGGILSFFYNGIERIEISFQKNQASYIDINLLDMKYIDTLQNPPAQIAAEFIFTRAEYWVLKGQGFAQPHQSTQSPVLQRDPLAAHYVFGQSNLILSSKWYQQNNPLCYFRSEPVFLLPSTLKLKNIVEQITVANVQLSPESVKKTKLGSRQLKNLNQDIEISALYDIEDSNGIVDLEFDSFTLFEKSKTITGSAAATGQVATSATQTTTSEVAQVSKESLNYIPKMSIFEAFEKCGGVQQILAVIQKQLVHWKNQEKAGKWQLLIQELNNFSVLPHFFVLFLKNKECIEILFYLLAGAPEDGSFPLLGSDVSGEEDHVKPKDKDSQPPPPTTTTTTATTVTNNNAKPANTAEQVAQNQKKWDEKEQRVTKFIYQTLQDVFRVDRRAELRNFILENQFFMTILDRIAVISKEVKREWVEQLPESESQPQDKQEDDQQKKRQMKEVDQSASSSQKKSAKLIKKKGVGYGSDNAGSSQSSKWDTTEYVESKKQRSSQLQNLISILISILDVSDWQPPKVVLDNICSSALLPLVEAAFRSSSLLEMSKESELMLCHINLVKVIAQHSALVPCLLDLDKHYKPVQVQSIYLLFKQMRDIAFVFNQCIKSGQQESQTKENLQKSDSNNENAIQQALVSEILNSFTIVEEAIEDYKDSLLDDEQASNLDQIKDIGEKTGNENAELEKQIQETLKLPLAQKYTQLLKDLRLDYVSLKDESGKYRHHYATYVQPNSIPPASKMVRLAQELADMSHALPIDHTNSIFVRCDSDRIDVMKAMIMGASGTPYAHGAFIYDVYFEDQYPNVAPKVNLDTTGAGKVRFNPNLYTSGKVCLSLLGTWRGNASENWDPKISTLLQVLVSLQAIIMSELVYFNEPGYENEQGTEEGERKNEAYSNIVRYCNIKFAMIDQIRNPPKGFETVIQRHFYLKKDEILEECRLWVKYADQHETSFQGLVNDHNQNWATEFKTPKKYKEMLVEAIKELQAELNMIPPPSAKDLQRGIHSQVNTTNSRQNRKNKKNKQQKQQQPANVNANDKLNKQGPLSLEEVDVAYEDISETSKKQESKELNIKDEKVMDRWSRYIGAMGIDAVAKQSVSSIFISGLGPLGIEIAKNIVLSGVKRLTLHDNQKASYKDLSGQFFIEESDIAKKISRVSSCLPKLQQLNYYVRVDICPGDEKQGGQLPREESQIESILKLKDYNVVVLTGCDLTQQIAINNYCRKHGIKFIAADVFGPWARQFNDFGDKFEVIDKNGEDPQELVISSISNEERGKVTLLKGSKHNFEDGDCVVLSGVEGMELIQQQQQQQPQQQQQLQQPQQQSINNSIHKIQVINSNSFFIGDTRSYNKYVRNGTVKNIKIPILLQYKSLQDCLNVWNAPFDQSMATHDFEKFNYHFYLHVCFSTLNLFWQKNNRIPKAWHSGDLENFIQLSKEPVKEFTTHQDYQKNFKNDSALKNTLIKFCLTVDGHFPPLAAFFGGYVSQDIIKAITGKYTPTKQYFYTDCCEVIPDLPEKEEEHQNWVKQQEEDYNKNTLSQINQENPSPFIKRTAAVRAVIGNQLALQLEGSKIFMVGCGAIGCELLKNFSMISLGTGGAPTQENGGKITITDPDHIENSNLNRQFLFREKHLRKPKSSTAAAAAIQMNPLLKGHIEARLDKVCEDTAGIYTDNFFESLSLVANALDNVNARRYVDARCVKAKIPLLESGTLGPKGHVQVIIPYKTESYGSQNDPVEDGEIPHCTLKMFPEETLHCVEWARDQFGKLFTLQPKMLQKIIEDKSYKPESQSDLKALRSAVGLAEKRPVNFHDCIQFAINKFYKYFRNNIRQLLHAYPLTHKTKDGEPFWKLPKRAPKEITFFNPKDELNASLITTLAVLRARIFGIPYPPDFRKSNIKLQIAEEASQIVVQDFKPSEDKAKSITKTVEKQPASQQVEEEVKQEDTTSLIDNTAEEAILMKKLEQIRNQSLQEQQQKGLVQPEEFEKDIDDNGHIDFIWALANCRALNYQLVPMDWMQVKLKAGRIIPALATTTAAIAGLQTIELVKLIKKSNVQVMKNAFLNLAVPILQLGEPGAAPKVQLHKDLVVTLWDRWDVKLGNKITIGQLFSHLEAEYKLKPVDLMLGAKVIYSNLLMSRADKVKERDMLLNSQLLQIINKEDQYVDFIVNFTKLEGGDILKGTPQVRVYFYAN